MQKIVQISLIAATILISGQNTVNRFFYELTYRPNKDSLQLEKEMMVLDVDKTQSVFQSCNNIRMDSLTGVAVEKSLQTGQLQDMDRFDNTETEFTYQISKNYPVHEISYKDRIGLDYYSYREKPGLNWKISDEKQQIGSYNCQKATTRFGGRQWIAWFTSDIPFQDGPYKFYGLPGLIIKIEDDAGNYTWVLKGNRKTERIADSSYREGFMSRTGISVSREISKEKFTEKYTEYKKDPFAGMRQMMNQIPAGAQPSDRLSVSKEMREAEKEMKEKLDRFNNSIELSVTK